MRDFGTTCDIFHTFAGKKETNIQTNKDILKGYEHRSTSHY